MLKERLLFLGIGQCGGNIAYEFQKLGYNSFYINTSNADLETVDSNAKYKIPFASGCAKDRNKALEFVKDYYNDICNILNNEYSTQDIVYICFSLSGGTGAGISPILTDILSHKYPNKNYGIIAVLPSENESIKAKENAVLTYDQIIKLENVKNVFLLDNNKREDKFQINNEFAYLFNKIVNITVPDSRGVIDRYELEKLLTCKGNSIIAEFNSLENLDTVFMDYEKGCKYIGLSMRNDFDEGNLISELGMPKDIYKGYNKDGNIFISVGMPYPTTYIENLIGQVKDYKNAIKENKVIEFDINELKNKNSKNTVKEFDFNSLFEKYK